MGLFDIEVLALVGFILGAYSTVANDSIQTLGTFLSSNSQRPWWVLWVYASSIIVAVMAFAFFSNGGDIAFGRLNTIPFPDSGIQWWHAVPPLVLLFLTRYGIPVSTTFLVLTIFSLTGGAATEGVMEKMLIKSGMGWFVAFAAGGLVYALVAGGLEKWVANTREQAHDIRWTIVQWCSTAFLWSQWLIQDLANIFVFLPRTTTVLDDGSIRVSFDGSIIMFATLTMLALFAIIFAIRGGEIQKIVTTKTNTTDVRAATLVDFIYGLILLLFKEWSDIPMSTTWVFLGLLAGREIAISYVHHLREKAEARFDILTDIGRAFAGLVVSVILAVALPATASGAWWAFALLAAMAVGIMVLVRMRKPDLHDTAEPDYQ